MLSPAERAAGERFHAEASATLLASHDTAPPTYVVPTVIAVYRHPCPARGNRSAALELTEIYLPSPAAGGVPAGRFGFIYREGTCRRCKQTARSKAGRLIERPPLQGRIARS